MKRKWIYAQDHQLNQLRMEFPEVPDVVLQVLDHRGFSVDDTRHFLYDDLHQLHDPLLLKDADKAVDLLIQAKENDWLVAIYADYDSDGINSAVIMYELLTELGIRAVIYTNNRFTQGYGMVISGVDDLLAQYQDLKLIITVDNGIMAHSAVQYAKEKGLFVVVTDHHEASATLPIADAVVDPKRSDDAYPFKGLCGAGVSFKLMMLLYWQLGLPLQSVYNTLDLVALATVGDIVPLVGENRILVRHGIEMIRAEKRLAFRILRMITDVKTVNAHWTLSMIYVPMLNAIGRMEGDPRLAIEMFLSRDEASVIEMVKELKRINEERKKLTVSQFELAIKLLFGESITSTEDNLPRVLVLYHPDFHEGIIGLIASRLKEKYNRPVIVFAPTESTENGVRLLKGSARSIDHYSLKRAFEAINARGGGHDKAGGVTIREDELNWFQKEMNDLANQWLTEEDLLKKYMVDARLKEIPDLQTVYDLEILEPFGEAFPKPSFLVPISIKQAKTLGNDTNVKFFDQQDRVAIAWGQMEHYQHVLGQPQKINALGFPEPNTYHNKTTVQFIIDNDNFIKQK